MREGPFITAIQTDEAMALAMLDEPAAPAYLRESDGSNNVMHFVALHNRARVGKRLLEMGLSHEHPNSGNGLPLHFAASRGSMEVVELFLNAGSCPDGSFVAPAAWTLDQQKYHSEAPILLATRQGHLATVKRLAQVGANLHTNPYGETFHLLHVAANGGFVDLCAYLLDKQKFSVDVLDLEGVTPLMAAASRGHGRVMACLIDHGADIHARMTVSGKTALHHAAHHGEIAPCQLLLAAGADRRARDRDGFLPHEVPGASNAALDYLLSLVAADDLSLGAPAANHYSLGRRL